MNDMLCVPDLLDDPAMRQADARAVQHFVETGEPLDPEVSARVTARADRVREKTRLRHGFVDIEALMRPSVDEE